VPGTVAEALPVECCMKNEFIILFFAIGICSVASVTDVRSKRIPNWLTYSAMLFGVGFHTLNNGVQGFLYSVEGLFLGLALLIIMYLLGGTGAGDVKLMGAVGALLGPGGVFTASVFSALIGGLYALTILIARFHLKGTFRRLRNMFGSLLWGSGLSGLAADRMKKTPVINYGVAIALGVFVSVIYTFATDGRWR